MEPLNTDDQDYEQQQWEEAQYPVPNKGRVVDGLAV
jgi:hypothetical protein